MVKMLHTRIRVSNLDLSIDWYVKHLGFEVVRRMDRSPGGNQLVFLALGGSEHTLEFAYSPDYKVAVPEDLMHIAIGVSDYSAFVTELESQGLEIWPVDWREKAEQGRKMAFITDPDGYEIEILERN